MFAHYIITICTPSTTFVAYIRAVIVVKLNCYIKIHWSSEESDDPQKDSTFTSDVLSTEVETAIYALFSEVSVSPIKKR
jgi:hypothetical protein